MGTYNDFTFVLQCIINCLASHKIATYHIFNIFQRNNNTYWTPGCRVLKLQLFGVSNPRKLLRHPSHPSRSRRPGCVHSLVDPSSYRPLTWEQ